MAAYENQPAPRKRRVWRTTLQMLVLGGFLLSALGASGLFAVGLCPDCPPRLPERVLEPQLPEGLEKGTQSLPDTSRP